MAEPLPQAPPPVPTDKDGNVYVRAADGTLGTVAPKDLPGVEASGGTIATSRDVQQSQIDALPTAAKIAKVATGDAGFWLQGGQFTPEGSTFTKGVASGATMGLSDLAGKGVAGAVGGDKLAQQFRDTSNAYDAESPLAAKLGEGVGMVAGSIAGGAVGGAGLAGRATLALPSAGISALGGAAESAMARATAGMLARGALGRAGSTALQWAARGAVEGALMEGMHQTTDDLFNDHELAADKILIAAGKGGLYGAGTGFVMGGLGSLAKSGAQGGLAALRGTAASVAERTEGALAKLEGAAAKIEGQADDGVNAARKLHNAAAVDAGALERVERGTGELATAGQRKAGAGWAENLAHGQAADALGAGKRQIADAAEALKVNPAQARKDMGKFILDNNLIQAGDTSADALARIQQFGEQRGKLIGAVFKNNPGGTIHMDTVYNEGKAVANSLRAEDNFRAAAKIEQYVQEMEQGAFFRGELSNTTMEHKLENFVDIRRRLSKRAFEEGRLDPAVERGLKDLNNRFENLVIGKLDELGSKTGNPELAAQYKSLKTDYQKYKIAEEWAENGTKAAAANQGYSLGDKIMTGLGLAAAGPVGALSGLGSKVARERGNATAAVLLYRMAQRDAASAALHTFDDVATRAASGMMKVAGKAETAERYIAGNAARQAERGYATGARKAATDGVQSRARAGMEEVKRLQDPATMQAHIDSKLGTLRQTAPVLANAMAFRMTQTAQFLASKMPEETKSYAPISAPSRKQSINPVQAARFLRYQEVAEDPQSAFVRFSRGEVRREDVEFMRECTPKAFETLQVRVLQRLTDAQAKGTIIPHEQRLKLSLLLDIKGDAMLEPNMFRVLQKNVSSPPSGQGAGGPQQAPKRPVQLSSTQLTGMDKLEQ